jgi:hypothetical protein
MAAMRQALQPTTQEAAVAARTEYRIAACRETEEPKETGGVANLGK